MEVDTTAEADKDKEQAAPAKMPEVKGTLDSQVYVYLMAVLHLLDQKRNPEVPPPATPHSRVPSENDLLAMTALLCLRRSRSPRNWSMSWMPTGLVPSRPVALRGGHHRTATSAVRSNRTRRP